MEVTPQMQEMLDRLRFGDEGRRAYGQVSFGGRKCALGQMLDAPEHMFTSVAVDRAVSAGFPVKVVRHLIRLNDCEQYGRYLTWAEIADTVERELKEWKDVKVS